MSAVAFMPEPSQESLFTLPDVEITRGRFTLKASTWTVDEATWTKLLAMVNEGRPIPGVLVAEGVKKFTVDEDEITLSLEPTDVTLEL